MTCASPKYTESYGNGRVLFLRRVDVWGVGILRHFSLPFSVAVGEPIGWFKNFHVLQSFCHTALHAKMLCYRGQLHPHNVVVVMLDQAARSGARPVGLYPVICTKAYSDFALVHFEKLH